MAAQSRFDKLVETLQRQPGVTNEPALAASIGRKKYGKKKFAAMGRKGRKGR